MPDSNLPLILVHAAVVLTIKKTKGEDPRGNRVLLRKEAAQNARDDRGAHATMNHEGCSAKMACMSAHELR